MKCKKLTLHEKTLWYNLVESVLCKEWRKLKYKNYYKILGLKNEKVSDEEIKLAYRHLAKMYHPDINGGNESITEKFKEVNEAYHVLGDSASRKRYDRTYFAYKFREGFSSDNTKNKINSENGFSEMFNMVFGKKEEKSVKTNLDKKDYPIIGEDLESEIDISLEEAFFGAEKKLAFKTINNGLKTISVKVPRGIRAGEKIRLQNQGKPGKNGGENGDLYIKVNMLPHEKFRLEGSDIVEDLLLTPWEAALGAKVEVQNIDANILVTVPERVTSGERLRIANSGYLDGQGGRGDLLLEIKIMIPKILTEEEEKLFKELKSVSKYCPRNI